MSMLDILVGVNYGLAFFFGTFLILSIVRDYEVWGKWGVLFAVYCPACLALQTISWLVLGLQATKQLYPLIVHLPLLAIFIFGLKKPVALSLVSICTSYLCCQLPRFGEIIVTAATGSELAGQIAYTIIIVPIYFFLQRYFVPSARDAMAESKRSLFLFGGLPVIYYIFDYATVIYSDVLYSGSRVVAQILPTAVGLLYMVYTIAYRQQLQRQTQMEMVNFLMASQLKQAEAEMSALRQSEGRTAVYQHDMRHHLNMLNGFLEADKPQQAKEYIKNVQADIESITPRQFCKNETVNLLCSSFEGKAERAGVRLYVDAQLPEALPIEDTELCTMLSNGLENAITAAAEMEEPFKWVKLYCGIRLNKLLIEIKNPYAYTSAEEFTLNDGLPVSTREGHGYGCRSIRSIVRRHGGICEFKGDKGVFLLQIMLPMKESPNKTEGRADILPS